MIISYRSVCFIVYGLVRDIVLRLDRKMGRSIGSRDKGKKCALVVTGGGINMYT